MIFRFRKKKTPPRLLNRSGRDIFNTLGTKPLFFLLKVRNDFLKRINKAGSACAENDMSAVFTDARRKIFGVAVLTEDLRAGHSPDLHDQIARVRTRLFPIINGFERAFVTYTATHTSMGINK